MMYFILSVLLITGLIMIKETNGIIEFASPLCSVPPPKGETCYSTSIPDDIPSVEERSTPFPENSIFFIETSCKGALDSHQMCAVEAAARAHPRREVNVLFLAPVGTGCLTSSPSWQILKLENVNIYRLKLSSYYKLTPLAILDTDGIECPHYRLSDVLSFLTLYKFGGIYLGFDVLVVKPFESLPEASNWAGKLNTESVDAGILALSKKGIGKKIAENVLRLFEDYSKIQDWTHNGTELLTKTLKEICTTSDVREMSAKTCEGFAAYSPFYFNPVNYDTWMKHFSYTIGQIPPDPVAFYLSNYLSYYASDHVYDEFLYARITSTLCPLTTEALLRKDETVVLPTTPQTTRERKKFLFDSKLNRLFALAKELY